MSARVSTDARVPGLLGRDVVERADGGAVAGDVVASSSRSIARPRSVSLAVAVVGDQDVAGVDVAVDQPLVLGVLQPQGDLPGQPGGGRPGDRAQLADELADVLPLDVLHHEVADPADSPSS